MLKKILYKTYSIPFHIKNIFIRTIWVKCIKKWSKLFYKSKNPLKWGFIGTGNMARTFAGAIIESRDNIVYAVLSRNIDKATEFAKQFDINQAYNDLNDFLNNNEIDIIYIATPYETHFEYVKACLIKGKNVLCEKPFVQTYEEARTLIDLAIENRCFLMEAMWSRLLPTFKQASEWITDGLIGNIENIRVEKVRYKNYKTSKRLKSVLFDYGIYPISFVQFFLKNVKVEEVVISSSVKGYDSDWHIILNDGDKKAIVDISGRYSGSSNAYIIGTEGTIEFQGHFNRTNIISLYNLNGKLVQKKTFKYSSNGFEYEVDEVNRLIRNGMKESNIANLKDTLRVIGLIEHIYAYTQS